MIRSVRNGLDVFVYENVYGVLVSAALSALNRCLKSVHGEQYGGGVPPHRGQWLLRE